MTLIQLKYILTIAETKSLNKAAEQLYVSQPSLTNALKELEKEIGITIFFRSGRGVTLTNDGVEFLTYARGFIMSMNSYCTVIQKAVLIRRNSQFPPSIIPLRSKRLWTLQRRWICHSMNLQSVKQRLQKLLWMSTQ